MATNTTGNSPRLEITIDAITSGLKQGLQEARDELKKFNDEVKKISFKGEFDSSRAALDALTASAKNYNSEIGKQASNTNSNTSAVTKQTGAYKSLTDATNKQRQVVRDLSAEVDNIKTFRLLSPDEQKGFDRVIGSAKTQLMDLESSLKAVNAESGINKRALDAAAGSYDAAAQRLVILGKAIRSAQNGFLNTTPAVQAQIREYNELNTRLKLFDASLGNHQRNVGNYSLGLGNATGVTMEFNRIIQDAPFGMMGIGNNIQQLAANWQVYTEQAKKAAAESGKVVTTGGLLRGVLTSMISPANLLTLGIAALTSGWVLYEKWQQSSKKATEAHAKEMAKAKDAVDEYLKSISSIAQASLDTTKAQAKEVIGLESLWRAYNNTNLSLDERKTAIGQIIQEHPAYFKGITTENALVKDLTTQYNNLKNSILLTAKARAFENKIVENTDKVLNEEEYLRGLSKQALELSNKITPEYKEQLKLVRATRKDWADAPLSDLTRSIALPYQQAHQAAVELQKVNAEIAKHSVVRSNINTQNLGLAKEYTDAQTGLLKFMKIEDDYEEDKKKNKKGRTKKESELTSDLLGDLKNDQGDYYDQKLGKIREEYEKLVDTINKSKGSKADISEALGLAAAQMRIDELRVSVERFSDAVKEIKPLGAGIGGVQNASSISLPSVLPIPDKYRARKTPKNLIEEDFSKQFQSTLRRGLANTFSGLFDGLTSMSSKSLEIEQKYASLRASATKDQIAGLNRMEALERKINNGLTNMLTKIGSAFGAISGNMLTSALSTGIASGNFKDLKNMFTGDNKAVGYGALGSLAGSTLSGLLKPSDTLGQSLSGVLSGAGTGAALGSIVPGVGTLFGALGGALLGGLSSLFGSSKRKKEEELLRLQLEEQKKMVALQERQAALSYQSSVIGQRVNEGIVTAIDRDAFGNLKATISGKDLQLILDRTKSGRG